MIQGFSEGLDIVAVAQQGDIFGNATTYMGNGFELLRQLCKEFSLRSKSEALGLRASLMQKTFHANAAYGAPVADTVRQIEVAVARYLRLVSDSDQLTLLIRSLPEAAKQYTLHHSSGETFSAYRASALRWEHQQRLFLELQGSKKIFALHESYETQDTEGKGVEVTDQNEGTVCGLKGGTKGPGTQKGMKCERCGKKGHERSGCNADLTKTKCFKCGDFGHISLNCKKSVGTGQDSKDAKGSSSGKGKGSSGSGVSSKGKGKGSGGKKGKMYAIFDEESNSWWYCDVESGELESSHGEEQSSVLVLAGLLQVPPCDCLNDHEPNTHETSGMDESAVIPGDESEATDLVMTVPSHLKGERAQIRSGCAPDSCFFGENLSEKQQLSKGNVSPLLQSLGQSLDEEYWLLDSGASCCVVNQKTLEKFAHGDLVPCGATFTAANGAPVAFVGKCEVVLKVMTLNSKGEQKFGIFKVPVMVGDTPYNILSTLALRRLGWRTVLTDGVSIENPKNSLSLVETMIWCETPWLKVKPHFGKELVLQVRQKGEVDHVSDLTGQLCGLKGRHQDELEVHRAKGHMPFSADCSHCLKAKGMSQHRRRVAKDKLETEIQADFLFVSLVGEIVEMFEGEQDRTLRVLVLKEMFSSSIGAVVMSANVKKDRDMLIHWLTEFGLASCETSISLVTDSEEAVQSFVSGCSEKFHFLVRKAAPQVREAVGGVEKVNRFLREQLAVLQCEFQSLGCVLVFRKDILQLLLNYVCLSHNCHGKAHGGERTPREMVSGGRLPQQEFALFGSRVHAEVPDSIRRLRPNRDNAAFLQPQFSSQGSLVFAQILVGSELVSKVFVAKSIKLVFPIEIVLASGMFTSVKVSGESGELRSDAGESAVLPRVLPKSQGASLKCPASGPPKEFFDRFGTSKNCSACESIDRRGTRQGLSHSKSCCSRYEHWLRIQISGDLGVGEPPPHVETVGDDVENGKESLVERALNSQEMREVFGSELDGKSTETHVHEAESEQPRNMGEGASVELPGYVFTRNCPSCESGMNAPGIRHSKACRLRNKLWHEQVQVAEPLQTHEELLDESVNKSLPSSAANDVSMLPEATSSDMETGCPMTVDSEAVQREDLKRASEVPVEELEREMGQEDLGDRVFGEVSEEASTGAFLSSVVAQAFALSDYVPVLGCLLDSVQFDQRATSVIVPFGDLQIRIWEPKSAVDDSTLGFLPGDETLQGMKKEVEHLNAKRAGDMYTAAGIEELKQRNPKVQFRIRTITCRWVTVRKGPGVVRARIVVKDVAGKSDASARSMGISSPTPSADSLFLLLGLAGERDGTLGSADVAHAFMATPLSKRDVIIRLPLSISSLAGEALYMHLDKALNGLRSASLEWVSYLSTFVAKVGNDEGVKSCSLEPCLFTGMMKSGPCALLCYVDDLLVMAKSESDVEEIFNLIGEHVQLKRTGLIRPSHDGGGQLKFLGRIVSRKRGERAVNVSIPSDYLDATFLEFGLKGGCVSKASAPPDVALHVEKENGVPLTPEAYSRFRSALGRVAWMTQTRQDLRAYVSILACQQSCPTNHTEQGLRSLLRFLQNDMLVSVRLPAETEVVVQQRFFKDEPHLVCYSDASHAPLRTTKRRGISGGVLTVFGCTIRTLSRHQQLISLSSMESELFALQMVAQEMSSLGKVCARVLKSFGETNKTEIPGVLFTDSEISLKLLKNLDMPKRSRHLEIRIEWLKGRVAEKKLVLDFQRGKTNPSDMLTKCLGSSLFRLHREALGFEVMSGPLLSLTDLGRRCVFVEVCSGPGSMLSQACQEIGMSYCGVMSAMEQEKTLQKIQEQIAKLRPCKVFVHVSCPYSTESMLRSFSGSLSKSDRQWLEMFPRYLKLGDESSFELPWDTSVWECDLCKETLQEAQHAFDTSVHLCQTGLACSQGKPVRKTLGLRN